MASVTSQRPVPHRNVPPSLGFPGYLKEGRAVKTFSLFRTAAGEREPLESFYLPAKGARAFFLPPWLQGTAGIRARPSAALTCGQRLTKPTHGCAPLPGPQCQGDPAGAGRWRNRRGALSELRGLRHTDALGSAWPTPAAHGVWTGTLDSSSKAGPRGPWAPPRRERAAACRARKQLA